MHSSLFQPTTKAQSPPVQRSPVCTRIYIHVAAVRYETEMGEGGVHYALGVSDVTDTASDDEVGILNLSKGAN